MSTEFAALFSRHAGFAFAKQLALADFLGDRNWGVNIQECRATFGEDLSYPIQLLGTESEGDSSWLWAWGNEASNFPPSALQACSSLRTLGEREGIREFQERQFSLQIANGHSIAMIATGINPECCYYRGPYDGGALFFLLSGLPDEIAAPVRAERAVTVITEVISQFDVDHIVMSQSFLASQEFDVRHEGSQLLASRGSDTITISFDSRRLITEVAGNMRPTERPAKSWWQFWKA